MPVSSNVARELQAGSARFVEAVGKETGHESEGVGNTNGA